MFPTHLCRLWTGLMLTGLTLFSLIGCKPQAEITQYQIPKAESIQLPLPEGFDGVPPGDAAPTSAGRPERMLGAIVPHKSQLWFFKLTGPVDPVSAQTDAFRELIASLAFNAKGEPEWSMPAGWNQKPGSGMRFSTLTIGVEAPLEVTVIALPGDEGPLPPQLLANINRWRNQLTLPPIALTDLETDARQVTTKDGSVATVVDYTGVSSGGGMMNAPFAQGGMMGGQRPAAATPSATPDSKPSSNRPAVNLTYDVPEGWKPGRVGGLRKAAFEIAKDSRAVEVTIIDLPAEVGQRPPNINRWRGQVGLPELDDAALQPTIQSLPIGDLTGDYVELVGDADAAKPQTILGVIVDFGEKAWFIKLQGDTELALQEKSRFESFAKSVRFK